MDGRASGWMTLDELHDWLDRWKGGIWTDEWMHGWMCGRMEGVRALGGRVNTLMDK